LLASCEREVNFDGQLPDAKIVINCFVEADSLISAYVSRSWNLSEDGPRALTDADVSLHVNDALQPPMQPVDSLPGQNSGYSHVGQTYLSRSVAREGDRIRITVRKDGYPEASAETVVPGKAVILSIDTTRFKEQYASDAMRFLIRFSDLHAGERDYYRLVVTHQYSYDSVARTGAVVFNYGQDAALNEGFRDATGGALDTEGENRYGIFTDDLFDGREYTLNIHFRPRYSGEDSGEYMWDSETGELISFGRITYSRYIFRLVTLSPSAYQYLKTRTHYGGDVFTEPSAIYTNITGGLGIMGSFQTDEKEIEN
jgi:hypothetical protein